MKRRFAAALFSLVLTASPAWAQEPKLTTKVYQVKWQHPSEVSKILQGIVGSVVPSDGLRVITATTHEVGHALIVGTLQKYDVRPRTIEFQFYLIKATSGPGGTADALPEQIRRVVQEVATLTRYRGFELIDSPVIRAREGRETQLSGKGSYFYSLSLGRGRGPAIVALDGKKQQIMVDGFGVHFSVPTDLGDGKTIFREVGVTTSLSMQDGETVVVGSSRIQDQAKESSTAIITVVTGKIVG